MEESCPKLPPDRLPYPFVPSQRDTNSLTRLFTGSKHNLFLQSDPECDASEKIAYEIATF